MEIKLILTELRLFKLTNFWQLLNYGLCTLCNQLLPQFIVILF